MLPVFGKNILQIKKNTMSNLYKDQLKVEKNEDIWILYRITGETKCPIYKDKDIRNIRKLLPYK